MYAIGDVHGCVDLLDALWARIMAHQASRPAAATQIVFLGDIVDRGPDSRGALAWLDAKRHEVPGVTTLLGNHEDYALTSPPRLSGGERPQASPLRNC